MDIGHLTSWKTLLCLMVRNAVQWVASQAATINCFKKPIVSLMCHCLCVCERLNDWERERESLPGHTSMCSLAAHVHMASLTATDRQKGNGLSLKTKTTINETDHSQLCGSRRSGLWSTYKNRIIINHHSDSCVMRAYSHGSTQGTTFHAVCRNDGEKQDSVTL